MSQMLGNSVNDPECNVAACCFDGGDAVSYLYNWRRHARISAVLGSTPTSLWMLSSLCDRSAGIENVTSLDDPEQVRLIDLACADVARLQRGFSIFGAHARTVSPLAYTVFTGPSGTTAAAMAHVHMLDQHIQTAETRAAELAWQLDQHLHYLNLTAQIAQTTQHVRTLLKDGLTQLQSGLGRLNERIESAVVGITELRHVLLLCSIFKCCGVLHRNDENPYLLP